MPEEFGAAFDDADRLVLMDVYSAGEAPIPGVGGQDSAGNGAAPQTANAGRLPASSSRHRSLSGERVREGDLVMTMGAGDVTTFGSRDGQRASEPRQGWVFACP